MKKTILSVMALSLGLMAMGQKDQVLMTIDGQPVMASEFMYIYEKNNQESSIEKKTMDEYVDLFVNFKLKVREAQSQGIDTTQAFIKELKGYRAQAIPKYMRDEKAIDSLVLMSYLRLASDRRAAHIAIACPMGSNDSTEKAARAQIEAARDRVIKGEDFFKVAKEVSTDPGVAENGGELGWITPFRYVYSFENAVYTTPIGEVTPVFRSAYGFHIALVEEEVDHEEVNAAHIMKMVPRGDAKATEAAKVVIDSLYQVIKDGVNFAEVAKAESDDKGSGMRGGDLGWFGRGYMVKPFEDAAFAMKDSGDVCEPFLSNFGWHFIQLKGRRGILPFDEMKGDILKKVQRDERMQEADKAFIAKGRAEYQLPDTMSDEEVRQHIDANLENKYEDLRHLVQEYHDGILLFDVSLKEVWDKASQDKEGLEAYFKAHRSDYVWENPKFKGFVVYAKDADVAKAVKTIIKSSCPDSVESYINQRINISDSITYVKVIRGLWADGQNKVVDKLFFKHKDVEFDAKEGLPEVFVVGKKIKAPEEYLDERTHVVNDYQDALEKAWVDSLRAKYEVVINQEVLEQLKK